MNLKINQMPIDVPVDPKDLLREVIKVTEERCKCSFDKDVKLYDQLLALIKKRKKEPMDLSCIE